MTYWMAVKPQKNPYKPNKIHIVEKKDFDPNEDSYPRPKGTSLCGQRGLNIDIPLAWRDFSPFLCLTCAQSAGLPEEEIQAIRDGVMLR